MLVSTTARQHPGLAGRLRVLPTLLLLFSFVLAAVGLATARDAAAEAGDVLPQTVEGWIHTLDAVQRQLEGGIDDSAQVDGLWSAVDQARQEALKAGVALDARNREVRRLIAALGAKPAAGEPAESDEVQSQRRQLDQSMAALESLQKQANLVVERSDGIRVKLTLTKRRLFSRDLSAKLPSPLVPGTWPQAFDEFGTFDNELQRTGQLLGSWQLTLTVLLLLAIGMAVAVRLSGAAARGLLLRHGQTVGDTTPGYRRRVRAAGIVALSLGLLPACLSIAWLTLIWTALERYHLFSEQTIKPIGISLGIAFYFLLGAILRAVFRPRTPAWRLMPLAAESARFLSRRLQLFVTVLAIDLPFARVVEFAGRPPAMASVHTFLLSLVLTLIGISLLPGRLWEWQALRFDATTQADELTDERQRIATIWLLARWFTTVAFGAACVATAAGYGNLGVYLTRGTLWSLLLIVVLAAFRGVTREALTFVLTGHETRPRTSLGMLNFWLLVGADAVLAAIGIVGVLVSWGIPWVGIESALHAAVGGFTVGDHRIVPGDILLGVAVFSVLVLVTRFVQRHLEESVLPNAHIDIGVRTAIGAVTGYIGIALAFVAAVSIMGIDLGQLALIAGALSVGIGFGLQNIVNNFISGAILLAEQPIKIGDWIVVGSIEGNVRRISIRATEIETFNRATVIVPNADLLQTAVTNWTYKNRRGRLDIAIGVGYQSDPDEVEAILLDCACRHDKVLKWPEAKVLLQAFGDSSLDFELRVFVSDIEQRAVIASDLRKSLLSRLRARGIEIPFPQRDIWVRRTGEAAEDLGPAGAALPATHDSA
ncbi:DUF3772 domain-containing protein [Methylolobus aquaticus]